MLELEHLHGQFRLVLLLQDGHLALEILAPLLQVLCLEQFWLYIVTQGRHPTTRVELLVDGKFGCGFPQLCFLHLQLFVFHLVEALLFFHLALLLSKLIPTLVEIHLEVIDLSLGSQGRLLVELNRFLHLFHLGPELITLLLHTEKLHLNRHDWSARSRRRVRHLRELCTGVYSAGLLGPRHL